MKALTQHPNRFCHLLFSQRQFSQCMLKGKPVTPYYSKVLSKSSKAPSGKIEKAQIAAGCFWGVELTYQRLPGVLDTVVGYTQGHTENPTYQQVKKGTTNHAETLEFTFDPEQLTFEEAIRVFFERHDSTQIDGQGHDIGSQYRSGIYYFSEEQRKLAEQIKQEFQALPEYKDKKIVTEIKPATKFWRAEEYHQQYLAKEGQKKDKGCKVNIMCH